MIEAGLKAFFDYETRFGDQPHDAVADIYLAMERARVDGHLPSET
jgi:hypothetical protein